MIPWPPCPRRGRTNKAKVGQIKLADDEIDDTHQVVFADPVFLASRNWTCPALVESV
jgi:hypothetical protein